MQSTSPMITVRSRQQAMDWSLVLISQGIAASIQPPTESASWALLVTSDDYERSLAILQQYRLENRRWPWRQEVSQTGLLFDWGSLAWVLLAGIFFSLQTHGDLSSAGRVDSTALAAGQWWRLFTAVWLHGDAGHLAANASIGLVLLGLVMGRYGTGVGLLTAYLAGVGGNLLAWMIWPSPHLSLGASGMVMGCVGLLTVQSFSFPGRNPKALKLVIGTIVAGAMLFILFGLSPETDFVAHFGGFLSGLLLGIPLTLRPRLLRSAVLNGAGGLTFALLVIWPWWLALSHVSGNGYR